MVTSKITAPIVKAELDNHLDWHRDVGDKMLNRHDILLIGKDGGNGLCSDVKEIKNGYATMKGIGVAILIALISNIIILAVK